MNFDRSTDGFSPLHWLNVIQRGGTTDWRRLYASCQDRAFAREIASMLARPDPDSAPACRLWRWLINDLHPGLFRLGETETTPAIGARGQVGRIIKERIL
jgi:hypothetical protein